MDNFEIYNEKFYKGIHSGSEFSANIILNIFFKLTKIKISSVIDFGCGDGSWLKVCQGRNLDIYGIDGPWANKGTLQISEEFFHPHNLEEELLDSQSSLWEVPKHDLLISLEVAEHLSEAASDMFIKFICDHCTVGLFSAAIPNQPGEYHINCQWPSYWQKKFQQNGFVMLDNIRKRIWALDRIPWWYRQNIVTVVKKEHLQDIVSDAYDLVEDGAHDLVHPRLFLKKKKKQPESPE